MFVGIKTHYVYGISGNELPPPCKEVNKTAYILDVAMRHEAMDLMKDMVMPLRVAADRTEPESYSQRDGYSWEVIKVEDYVQ